MIGPFKTETTNRLGPCKAKDQIGRETLQRVDWLNKECLLEFLGCITPIKADEKYEQALNSHGIATRITNSKVSGKTRAVHTERAPVSTGHLCLTKEA